MRKNLGTDPWPQTVTQTPAYGQQTNASLSDIDAAVGAKADSVATTDTDSFSIIAFIKRSLQNWTSMLAVQGAFGNVAVTGDTAGTVSAKLRGLSKMIFDVWDSTNHWWSVNVSLRTGTLAAGAQTAVSSSAVQVLAANANRKSATIQNAGIYNMRVGVAGVTATTGAQVQPGAIVRVQPPYVETNAFYAIREGSFDTIAYAQEST